MAKLVFAKDDVQRVVKHMMSAASYGRGYGDKKPPRPQIVLVKDDGIYLMSNGKPGDSVDETRNFAAYAKGYDPREGDVWDKCRDAVGGDDFAEYLDLNAEFICAILAGDFTALEINLTQFRISISLAGSNAGTRKLTEAEMVKKLATRMKTRILFIKTGRVMTTGVMKPAQVRHLLMNKAYVEAFTKTNGAEVILNLMTPADAYRLYREVKPFGEKAA